jgi:ankyrin repeat protein
MSLFLQLPAELLDIVFHNFFLEEWIDSKEKYNLALKLRAVSRGCFRRPTQWLREGLLIDCYYLGACDLSIRRLITVDRFTVNRSLEPDGDSQKRFWEALVNGYPAVVVQQLLERTDVDPNCWDGQGPTPLTWSGYRGYDWLVRPLLKKGADVNSVNHHRRTALHEASWSRYEDVMRLLLERGANTNAKDENGSTALHDAARKGHVAVVLLLLEMGADINTRNGKGETALHEAAWKEHEAVLRLLEKGANRNAKKQNGSTALHQAAGGEHEMTVWLLLEHGMNIDAKDGKGETALHLAVRNRQELVIQLLLGIDANIDTTNWRDKTALHLPARIRCEIPVELNWLTTLDWAVLTRHQAIAKFLLDYDVGIRDNSGKRPIREDAES